MLRPSFLVLALAALFVVDSAAAQISGQPNLVHRVYPVADLVTTIGSATAKPAQQLVQVAGVELKDPAGQGLPATCEQQLIHVIESSVAAHSWANAGGAGTITYLPGSFALVVNQTPEVHEKVQQVITALRRLQEVQVAMDVQMVTISDRMYEHIAKECDLNQNPSKLLDRDTVAKIQDCFQGDRRAVVMHAPKMTMFNGQESCVVVGEERFFVTGMKTVLHNGTPSLMPQNERFSTGSKITIQPTVTPDNRSVVVKFQAEVSEMPDSIVPLFPVTTFVTPTFEGGSIGQPIPFTQFIQQPTVVTRGVNKVFGIPEGQTGFIYAGRCSHSVKQINRVPVLGELPLVGDLFVSESNSEESNHLIFLVTPKVILTKAEEAHAAAGQCCDRNVNPDAKRLEPSARFCFPSREVQVAAQPIVAPKPSDVPMEVLQGSVNPKLPLAVKPTESKSGSDRLEQLMTKYRAACAEGRMNDAKRLAGKCIEIDPSCFVPAEK